MKKDWQESIKTVLVARRAAQFSFLAKLVNMRSESSSEDYSGLIEYLTDVAEELGFDVESDVIETADNLGEEQVLNANLIVRHSFGPGPVIALSTNVDTAPVGEGWKHDPFGGAILAGKMYGRGVATSKGDIAAYLYALRGLCDADLTISGTVEIHLYFDGEKGGELGSERLLENNLTHPDMVISGGSNHSIISSVRGCLRLLIEVIGRQVPQAKPENGGDAVETATSILTALSEIRSECNSIASEIVGIGTAALSIVRIDGVHGVTAQAGKVTIEIDRYLIPEEDPKVVEGELTNRIGLASIGRGGAVCRVRKLKLQETMTSAQGSQQLIDVLQKHSLNEGEVELPVMGAGYASGGRHYASRGIPTVFYGSGPKNAETAGINGPDEFLELDDLRRATSTITMTLASLLGDEADKVEP